MSNSTQDTDARTSPPSTILVVEPDILVRMVIANYLRECGYTVIEAVSAEEALTALASKTPIHVVLTDVRLSGSTDGFGLAQHVRQHFPGIDVILTSSATAAASKAGDLCDDGPLQKPYHPQEIVRRINLLRERRRAAARPRPPK